MKGNEVHCFFIFTTGTGLFPSLPKRLQSHLNFFSNSSSNKTQNDTLRYNISRSYRNVGIKAQSKFCSSKMH